MFYDIKTGQIKIENTYMDYYAFGTGGQALLMLQGLRTQGIRGTALPMAYRYREFAKKFRVYLFDRRNAVPEDFSIWDIADDIRYAMDELRIAKASVFGISQGGMIAQALAICVPDRIEKLVLGCTLSRPNETAKKVIGGWITYAERGDYESINRETFTYMYSEAYLKKYKLFLPVAVKLVKPENLKKFCILAKSCITFDAYERLAEITCPVFVIGGRLDRVTTGEAAEEIARKLNCPLQMYEQYGHAAYDEAPDFNRKVLAFLVEPKNKINMQK